MVTAGKAQGLQTAAFIEVCGFHLVSLEVPFCTSSQQHSTDECIFKGGEGNHLEESLEGIQPCAPQCPARALLLGPARRPGFTDEGELKLSGLSWPARQGLSLHRAFFYRSGSGLGLQWVRETRELHQSEDSSTR